MIDVALTPAELRRADVAVVIDVLRATSTVARALAAGYEEVLCVDSIEYAAGLRGPGRVLAAERRCLTPLGFDQGNSPLDAAVRRGRELVLATTNGAPTIVAAARCAPTVLLASVLNLDAISEALAAVLESSGTVVQLVCAGTEGAPALEDTYLAGRLCQVLPGERTDAARIAEAAAHRYQTPIAALRASAHAATLGAAELDQDVEYCALESRLAVVPHVVAASARTAVVRSGGPAPHRGLVPKRTELRRAMRLEPSQRRFVRKNARAGAQAILDAGGWCVLEFCIDVPSQRWEVQLLIFELQAEAVAGVVSQEIHAEPGRDARLTGCDRRTLRPSPEMGVHLCYLTEPTESTLRAPG